MNGFKHNTLGFVRAIISSHALFNSLSSIQNNVASDEKRAALQNLSEFGKFLRSVATLSAGEFTEIKTESAFLNQYLSLEKMRFGDALQLNINFSVNNEFLTVPSLILQPLAEQNLMYCIKCGMKQVSLDIEISETDSQIKYFIKTNRKTEVDSEALSAEQLDRVQLLEHRIDLFKDAGTTIENTTKTSPEGSIQIITLTK